jgi:hypothetical protein
LNTVAVHVAMIGDLCEKYSVEQILADPRLSPWLLRVMYLTTDGRWKSLLQIVTGAGRGGWRRGLGGEDVQEWLMTHTHVFNT